MTRRNRRNVWLVVGILVLFLAAAGAWSQVAWEFTPGEVGGCWFESLNDSPPPAGAPDGEPGDEAAGGGGGVPDSEPEASVSYAGTCHDGPAYLTP